jgi:hypothetical protein
MAGCVLGRLVNKSGIKSGEEYILPLDLKVLEKKLVSCTPEEVGIYEELILRLKRGLSTEQLKESLENP